jgi:hypothetical protein
MLMRMMMSLLLLYLILVQWMFIGVALLDDAGRYLFMVDVV